ncbi:cupredoxin domain-containing protein [Sabulicella glaciei]|uniref:Cupredoxin domain-containing protein n=1 Tax=Sabulicella glaciei TaxID=2984948 RepID=A0ABT3P252_9PROT|nr:hypothetical protein [Roseococcus sp. MDT2-1-1]MCW8088489.1 cupredoxin domain-containing protein [Roseococcus sp. MDT2-1-1]
MDTLKQARSARMRRRTFVLTSGMMVLGAWQASAQMAQQPPPGHVASHPLTQVELTINVLNDNVRCDPQRMRLPSGQNVSLRLINNSNRPTLFVAPEFFRSSEAVMTDSATYNAEAGGFLVQAGSTVPVRLKSPPAGEFSYACQGMGGLSTVRASGFIVVVDR